MCRRTDRQNKHTCGSIVEVRQVEVDGELLASGADLCPVSHREAAAVIRLAVTHASADMCKHRRVRDVSKTEKHTVCF